MKILMIFLLLLRIFYHPASAQHYNYYDSRKFSEVIIEGGITAGIMNCFTDIGGKEGKGGKLIKDLTWNTFRPSGGINLKATYRNAVSMRIQASTGSVTAADSNLQKSAANSSGRYWRNLSFHSRMKELLLTLEVHPLCIRYDYYDEAPAFSPYLISGVGYFNFNPKAMLDGKWHSLQPLRTEGQGLPGNEHLKPYKLSQFSFAIGTGLRYEAGRLLLAGIEIIHRFTRTDYLDDVSTAYPDPDLLAAYLPLSWAGISQRLSNRSGEIDRNAAIPAGEHRGNPGNRDSYFTIMLSLWIRLSGYGK